jgi:hypothetical protein
MDKKTGLIIPAERIQQCIYLIRKQKVILDKDLAALYGVTTKRLNEQVQRNIDRFPSDFMFQLNNDETKVLKSQIATSKKEKNEDQGCCKKVRPMGNLFANAVILIPVSLN